MPSVYDKIVFAGNRWITNDKAGGIMMNQNDDLMQEELDNLIVLTDEDGNDVSFEFLDLLEYEGEEYVVLLPTDEESDEVVILLLREEDDETESYLPVESEETLNAVFELFKDKFKDEFNFED